MLKSTAKKRKLYVRGSLWWMHVHVHAHAHAISHEIILAGVSTIYNLLCACILVVGYVLYLQSHCHCKLRNGSLVCVLCAYINRHLTVACRSMVYDLGAWCWCDLDLRLRWKWKWRNLPPKSKKIWVTGHGPRCACAWQWPLPCPWPWPWPLAMRGFLGTWHLAADTDTDTAHCTLHATDTDTDTNTESDSTDTGTGPLATGTMHHADPPRERPSWQVSAHFGGLGLYSVQYSVRMPM